MTVRARQLMSKYHDPTLHLLPPADEPRECEVSHLLAWAKTNDIQLPAAYLEWARLDGKRLLTKYSNGDSFYFVEPQIIKTPKGATGLLFHQEKQANFQKIVLLNQGEDPPVMFAWLGKPPWITFSQRFSESVFAVQRCSLRRRTLSQAAFQTSRVVRRHPHSMA